MEDDITARPSSRSVFAATDFLHPLDFAARQQLEGVPMLRVATQKYMSYVSDRRQRQMLLSHAIRLGPRQLPHIYRLLPPICEAFGIPEPELYLMPGPPNAWTTGHTRTAVVLHSPLLEELDEDQIQAVMAHECGHILAEHLLYRQMAGSIVAVGDVAGSVNPTLAAIAKLAQGRMTTALLDWYRKSELTADRAAAVYMGDPEPLQRGLFRLLGVPKWMPGEVSITEFAAQAKEYEEATTDASRWDRWLARRMEIGTTHPFPTHRMLELTTWSQSDAFRQLVDLARRTNDASGGSCPACAHTLQPNWRFCQHCGHATTVKEG
jgi:Zn-dependent protease with chaperone function